MNSSNFVRVLAHSWCFPFQLRISVAHLKTSWFLNFHLLCLYLSKKSCSFMLLSTWILFFRTCLSLFRNSGPDHCDSLVWKPLWVPYIFRLHRLKSPDNSSVYEGKLDIKRMVFDLLPPTTMIRSWDTHMPDNAEWTRHAIIRGRPSIFENKL